MKLTQTNFVIARDFIRKNARPLDRALFDYKFEEKPAKAVLAELQKFQNSDGGFGHGLEPDVRVPNSSAIATTIAFQYIHKLELKELPDFMEKATEYLLNTYSSQYERWLVLPPETNEFPRAIWWEYDLAKLTSPERVINPSVEIAGILNRYTRENELSQKLVSRFINQYSMEKSPMEMHDIMCYARFAETLDTPNREVLEAKINSEINKVVEKDTSKWSEYGARPLMFLNSPNSPYYKGLEDLVEKELEQIITSQIPGKAWFPIWEWRRYETDWEKYKPEVAGLVSVNYLIALKNFGKIEE